jgi:hypothetical protein
MKLKRKYLHIETINGDLFVYADDKSHRGTIISLDDMDDECNMSETKKNKHFVISLEEFIIKGSN